MEAGEGLIESDTCVLGDEPGAWESVCPMHESWTAALAVLKSELATTSLATLLERDLSIAARTYLVTGHGKSHAKTVDVTDSVHIERPVDVVSDWLEGAGTRLVPHAEAAHDDGEAILLRVGPGGPKWLAKTVAVHVGDLEEHEGSRRFSLRWEAAGPSGLFPRLVGSILLTELDEQRTEVTLRGHYRPPLGAAGAALDDLVLSRVAHATMRSLLLRVDRAAETH